MICTVGEVGRGKTLVDVDFEELGDCFSTLVIVFDADEIFIICARLVSLNEIDKLLLCDLKLLSSPLGVFHGGVLSVCLFWLLHFMPKCVCCLINNYNPPEALFVMTRKLSNNSFITSY
jgi:hypothetical protein